MNQMVDSAVKMLVPRDDQARAVKLADYIRSAKDESKVLKVDWNEPYWEGIGYFVKQAHAPRGSMRRADIAAEVRLDGAFIDFAKAYVVERHLLNPGESRAGHIKRLQLLRLLEESLLAQRGKASPLDIDLAVMDATASLAKKHLATSGSYRAGVELVQLAEVMVRFGIWPVSCVTWANPNKQPKNHGIGVGEASERARQDKLPDHRALYALAEVFNKDFDLSDERCHKDVVTSSVSALLMCAPSRGQEIFRLPANLEFEATDKFGKEQLGLRLHASKGFGAYVKWVWAEMVPVAERAIRMLRDITEEGRKLARHLEDPRTKGRFYRHENCPNVADDHPLTKAQVCYALGFSTASGTYASLSNNGLERADGSYTLQTLWDTFVLPRHAKEHPHFPYVSAADKALGVKGGLKFSEALFCMRRFQLHARSGTSPLWLWMPDLTDLNHEFKGRKTHESIFARYGYLDEKGAPLKLTSHQARHLINTEAQRAGLTDEQIAHWSGRRRVDQNAAYDHRSQDERAEQARGIVESVQAEVGLPSSYRAGQWTVSVVRSPRNLADIDSIQPQLSGLKTLYGECHHDWSFAPCEGFVKCLDCSEHACIKGEEDADKKLERLRALYASVAQEVSKAEQAAEDDVDAQDWLNVQQRYMEKVQQLIEILESEVVPDGSVIRTANGQNPTHLHRALRGLAAKALELGTSSRPAMEQLLSSLEAGLGTTERLLQPAAGAGVS